MTTATKQAHRVSGTRTLVVTMVAVDLAVVLVGLVAALVGGQEAGVAALVGGFATTVVLFTGTMSVNAIAGVMPSASLLVAMLTYLLQLLLMGLVFAALAQTSLADDDTSRAWLGGAVIAAASTWLVAQIVAATRARIPAYDVPDRALDAPRPSREGGGEG